MSAMNDSDTEEDSKRKTEGWFPTKLKHKSDRQLIKYTDGNNTLHILLSSKVKITMATLVDRFVGGAEAGWLTSKLGTFFAIPLALHMPIFKKKLSNFPLL